MLHFRPLFVLLSSACLGLLVATSVFGQDRPVGKAPKVVVQDDGTVEVPAQTVPMSSFLSPEAKAYVAKHLKDMQDPEILKQDAGVPRFMKGYLARDYELFAVEKKEDKIGGIHAYVYTPKAGVSARNKDRVLINLHGGGFSGCWPGCAELESIPVSALGQIEVVSVDYREGPDYKFPAASEDVASVYQELLKTHQPKDIGIYGCSAGGIQTAMSKAWFTYAGSDWDLLCVCRRCVWRRRFLYRGANRRGAHAASYEPRSTAAVKLFQRN